MSDESGFFTVETTHTTFPKGMYKYAFPTDEAAGRFAGRTVMTPGISHARVLDPEGRVVVEFSQTENKDRHTWEPTTTAQRGFSLRVEPSQER